MVPWQGVAAFAPRSRIQQSCTNYPRVSYSYLPIKAKFLSYWNAIFPLCSSFPIIEACTSGGAAKHGTPIELDAPLKVDLIVIGSVAVDPFTGARLGKGEGFAELEYGMLRYMGAIDDSTLVVTSVHDVQVLEEGSIPTEKLLIHDVPVDVICTPTRTIFTKSTIPKPKGIYWEVLSPQKLEKIRILQVLKNMIEEKTGQKLPSGPDEILPPTGEEELLEG
ncbi:hypothetical protein R1flu_007880 [Riccia fluitans]|uniref:5-formyltetrahydrofolate cyclo-ligase n=1 Tax=Riccia fluitans TaxID=41844 RepID=A0ABD1Z064_9MARC